MANQLIPPPGMEPTIPANLTPEQRIALWVDLANAGEELLLAGLRRKVGPQGDVVAAYREWYAEQMLEHDQMIRRMAASFYRRGVRHGR